MMVKDSLKNLLNKFPYFLDKRESSNFYKSQYVTNEQFKNISQALFEVSESFNLEKRVWIWKEQEVPFEYIIHFAAVYPHLKTVRCYKNEDVIYTEEYSLEDNVSSFFYIYDSAQENETLVNILADNDEENENIEIENEQIIQEIPIIPEDRFHIYIETYDELLIEKGFPENDTILEDIYDHDASLDKFGKICNVPRKNYITTDDYSHTEPPYNNCLTEDDYHYMNRLLNYLQKIHTTPLPILEIWKLYGLEASMNNRERFLLKLFDEDKHDFDYDSEHVFHWTPKKWEHKDGFADFENGLGKYFFVSASTNFPRKWRDIKFTFRLLNNLAEELDENFTIKIMLNNTKLDVPISDNSVVIPYNLLDEETTNIFKFIAYDNKGEPIGEETIEVNVQGCNNADFYVSNNGNDITGDGSRENPYHTLNKALEYVTDVKNMIAVQGDISVNDATIVNNNCTILGCGNAAIHNDISNSFFHIVGNKNLNLTLVDITLDSNGAIAYIKSSDYTNLNLDYYNYLTVLVNGGAPLISFEFDKLNYYSTYDNIIISGIMKSKENNPIKNANLKIYVNGTAINASTANNGSFTATIPILNFDSDTHEIKVSFDGSDTYISSDLSHSVQITKEPETISLLYGDAARITSSGHSPGETIKFYTNNTLIESKTADSYGEVTLEYTPEFGATILYISPDGISIDEEWVIETSLKINNLNVDSFVTDLNIDDETGDLRFEKTPLSDFQTIRDLEGILLDVTADAEEIIISRFESNYNEDEILDGDTLYLQDITDLFDAITDLSIVEDSLKCTRMGDLTEGDE